MYPYQRRHWWMDQEVHYRGATGCYLLWLVYHIGYVFWAYVIMHLVYLERMYLDP